MAEFTITTGVNALAPEHVESLQDILEILVDFYEEEITEEELSVEEQDGYHGKNASDYLVYLRGKLIGRIVGELF